MASALDRRFMGAAIRLSRKNVGLTATNPSVGTLIVRDGIVVGRGVTAIGGRPHAETEALAEAGELARGATAYVTLEPCAHHGRTPPCAEALAAAGVVRVVGAASDPDPRVSGRGYEILRRAGIEVEEGVLAEDAARIMAGYLHRSVAKRPDVILKLAVSAEGMIGRRGHGQVAITGPVARAQVHLMRAEADAILVGIGTALADDPELTCRLPGLENRSPRRIVIDPYLRLPTTSKLAVSARQVATAVAGGIDADPARRAALEAMGVAILAAEIVGSRVALPELLDDFGAQGMASLMVEGGASVAAAFLEEDLVDRIALYVGELFIGSEGVASPVKSEAIPTGFRLVDKALFGPDRYLEYERSR